MKDQPFLKMLNDRKPKIIALASGVLSLMVSFSLAQTPIPDHPLTWNDCVELALRNNPDLVSSQKALEASKASYYGSYNGLMPQLTLSNSYSDSDNYGGSRGTTLGPPTWQGQGTLSLNLFNASQIASIKTSHALLAQAEANLRQTSSVLRFNLYKAYSQLLFAQRDVEVSLNIRDMRQESAQLVTLRYNSGTESKGNMLRAKAQFLQAKTDLAQAIRDKRTAQWGLDSIFGLDHFTAIVVTNTHTLQSPENVLDHEESLVLHRPDVALQEAVVKTAEANLKQSHSTLWPNLSANYSRFTLGSTEFPSAQYGWNFNAILNYPLFGGGPTASYFAISAAKNSLEKSRQDLHSTLHQAIVDLEASWSNFTGAMDQTLVQAALLEAARQRNEEANIRYASGLLTYDNWEIIASDRINQERQAIQSQLNAENTEAAWIKSLGKQLEEQ